MASMKAVGTIFTAVRETVRTNSGSAVNIIICLVTVGSEQLFTFAAFTCPCPYRPPNSTETDYPKNFVYGWIFIIVPAVALFILGYAMNTKTWKLTTGCCRRSERASRGFIAGVSTFLEICLQSLVAPMAWTSVAFLDGKYYACAASKDPYVSGCDAVMKHTQLSTSLEYNLNKQKSQIVGWGFVAATLFFGSLFYMIHRCCSPLTYHHRKYARWYREMESQAFQKRAKEQIQAEVECETVARFLQKKRSKHDWDKISTVFNFTRDEKNFALYSRLDKWNEDNKEENPLLEEVEIADEATENPNQQNQTGNNNKENFGTHEISNGMAKNMKGKAERNLDQDPFIPKIAPPPHNARKHRFSSSGFEDIVTSQHVSDGVPSQPDTNVTSPVSPTVPEATEQQSNVVTTQATESSSRTDDSRNKCDLIKLKCLSMSNVASETIKSENGKVHVKSTQKLSSHDDETMA